VSPDTNKTYSVLTSLSDGGAVCCWGVYGACSVCSDQDRNGQTNHRAYILTGDFGVRQAMNGNYFTVDMDTPSLAPGNHTIDVYFLAETLFQDPTACDNEGIKVGQSAINGWTYGEQNTQYNTHLTGTFEVAGTGGLDDGMVVPPPPADNTFIYLIGAAAAVFFIYMIRR
jgi:hypothetical protein